jgi:hypothetical protein
MLGSGLSLAQAAKGAIAREATRHRIWAHELSHAGSGQPVAHGPDLSLVAHLVHIVGRPSPVSLAARCTIRQASADRCATVIFVGTGPSPSFRASLFRSTGAKTPATFNPAIPVVEQAAHNGKPVMLICSGLWEVGRGNKGSILVCTRYALLHD